MQELQEVGSNDIVLAEDEGFCRYIYQVMTNHIRHYNEPEYKGYLYTYFECESLDDVGGGLRIHSCFPGGHTVSFDIGLWSNEDPDKYYTMYFNYVDSSGVAEDHPYLEFDLSQFGIASFDCVHKKNITEYDVSSLQGCDEILVYSLMKCPFFYFLSTL